MIDSLLFCSISDKSHLAVYPGEVVSNLPLSNFRRCGRKWTGSNKLLPPGVYREIQAFKGSRTKEQQIALFRKHHFINGKKFVQANDGKANTTGNLLTVGPDKEQILFLSCNADLFQGCRRNPGVFTACVHQDSRDDRRFFAINGILNFAAREKCTHTNLLPRRGESTAF